MRQKLIIGAAVLLGFVVIGTESWLLAKPETQSAAGPPPQTSAPNTDKTWAIYKNAALGFSIDYPNDATYVVTLAINQSKLPSSTYNGIEPQPIIGSEVWITQPPSMFTPDTVADQENFQIYVTSDPNILISMPVSLQVSSTKVINGLLFQKLTVDPEVLASRPFLHDYAYAIKHNGQYYVFQSTRGPNDSIFEQMMLSLRFD